MSAQDIGDLADYILNGDNYERIGNNTLVIPGQYGRPPLVPDIDRDTYRPIGGDNPTCAAGNCALFAHYCTTTVPTHCGYVILRIAGFDQTEEDCLCALAGLFLQPNANCIPVLQKFVDDSDNQVLYYVIPEWYLQELGILDQEFTATAVFDFWFTGCIGDLITIPNLPSTPQPPVPPQGCVSYSFWGKGCRIPL